MDDNSRCCDICKQSFKPDPRVGIRQRVCSRLNCQKERKQHNNQAWRAKEANADYFKGRYPYLKEWLEQCPGYLKNYRKQQKNSRSRDIQVQITLYNNSKLRSDDIQVQINSKKNNKKQRP